MIQPCKSRVMVYATAALIMMFVLSACELPLLTTKTTEPTPGIPNSVMTAAAATIQAQVAATQAQAPALTQPPTVTSGSPIQPPINPAAPTSPPLPPTVTNTPPTTSTPTYTPTITLIPTITYTPYTPVPSSTKILRPGTFFYVDGVNISMCSGTPWAVFAIYNDGTNDLESLSLSAQDRTTGHTVLGPVIDNTPFMPSDKSCNPGHIDYLTTGHLLFVGGRLTSGSLSGHTLRATVRLCSRDGLAGTCLQKTVDFVVP